MSQKTWNPCDYLAFDNLKSKIIAWGPSKDMTRSRAIAKGLRHPYIVFASDWMRAKKKAKCPHCGSEVGYNHGVVE